MSDEQKEAHIQQRQASRYQHYLDSKKPAKRKTSLKRKRAIKKVFKDTELQQIFEQMNAKQRRLLL